VGMLVARRLYGNDARVGWGLEAALGMAVHLALGSLLAMLSLVSVTTSYITVTLGWARLQPRQPVGICQQHCHPLARTPGCYRAACIRLEDAWCGRAVSRRPQPA
jgi:hypothetical protein